MSIASVLQPAGASHQRCGCGSNALARKKNQDALLAKQYLVQEADESNPHDRGHVHAAKGQCERTEAASGSPLHTRLA